MTRLFRPGNALLLGLLLAVCLLASACAPRDAARLSVLLDGRAWDGAAVSPDSGDGLRVYITLDGQPVIDLPFSEAHTVRLIQSGVGENTVELTGEAVYMAEADCENQDCVNMGAVTRDNLELRVMGGFIVCLPHKISVEVRGE